MSNSNVEANREHFAKENANYDNPFTFRLGSEISRAILQFPNLSEREPLLPSGLHLPSDHEKEVSNVNTKVFNKDETKVLDFACGTGIISMNLAPHVKQVVGVDISTDMIDIFNGKVAKSELSSKTVGGYEINLFDKTSMEAHKDEIPVKYGTFDVGVCSLGYHHLDDIDLATKTLYDQLVKGGYLYVVDLSRGPENVHPDKLDHDSIVPHRGGFSEDEMKTTFEKAGFKDIDVKVFNAPLWVNDAYIKKFQKHHTLSEAMENGKIKEGLKDYIHGARFYGQMNVDGEAYYLIKKRMVIAVGRRLD